MARRSCTRTARSSTCTPLQSGPRWRWRALWDSACSRSACKSTPAAISKIPRIEHMRLPSVLTGDRGDIARSRTKTVQPPAAAVPGRVLDPQHLRRLPRCERHIEAIERDREATAERLHERFLARPAVEEPLRPVAWVEGPVGRVLAAREIVCRDVVGVAHHPDGFEVNADRVSA